jgi:preprotein translocase subunit SecG
MLLYYSVATLHVLVCVILILVVLLQSGKGADLSGAFGGGATQTAFGARGPQSFLSKMTTVAAILFMITSIALTMMTRKTAEPTSVLEQTQSSSKPAATTPAKQTQATPALTPDEVKKIQAEIEAKQQQAQQQPAQTQTPSNSQIQTKVEVTTPGGKASAESSKTPGTESAQQPSKESKPPAK